jgi:hypothetical protein
VEIGIENGKELQQWVDEVFEVASRIGTNIEEIKTLLGKMPELKPIAAPRDVRD